MVKNQLSKEQEAIVKGYAEKIKTIELFVDSVRKNPGEYLSSIGNEGWMNCVREVFQNGIDEMSRPISFCDTVWFTYYEGSHRCIVEDNGRALAPDIICRVFTREHTSTNFEKAKGEYPSGLHGVGSKCVNAVSSRFSVYSYYLGKCYYMEFSEGKPLKRFKNAQPIEIPNKISKQQGLIVDFEPDFSIMKSISLTCEDVLKLASNIVPLTKPGNKVIFTGYKNNGQVIKEVLVNQDGVLEYLVRKTTKPLIKPILYSFDSGVMKADIALTWVADLNLSPDVITFANMTLINTQLSTPSQGFFKGVQEFFRNYMNKIFLVNNKRAPEVIGNDILVGLKAAVASAHMNVMFDGQAKNVCKNTDLFDFVKKLTIDSLGKWVQSNAEDVQKLCTFFKDVATVRVKSDKDKLDVSRKYRSDNLLRIPPGFIKAERKDHLELFIVEGLSASGPCQLGRNSEYQAIFAIRGKMPNAMSTSRENFLKNEEVQAILGILGCGYGKNFDLSKCKYDKIIILSDADVDGYHIRTLVLKFLLLYCRPLVEAGRVYCGVSPLYHINRGKPNWAYFIDKSEFLAYVQDQFSKNFQIINTKTKKPYTKSQIHSIIIQNNDYKDLLDHIAGTYSIYPVLLEDLLIARNYEFKKFKKFIESKYRFTTVSENNKIRIIDGLANEKSHTVILHQSFMNACTPLLPYIDNAAQASYICNGKQLGLYELLKLFRESEPKNISRAKGLGTLKPLEIGISTLNPKNRTLLRYTCQDIEKEIEEMRRVNADKFCLIKDVDISTYEF